MPQLNNPKWETFALHVAGGASLTDATVRAGFSPNGAANNGSRLAKRADVSKRIEEIRHLSDDDNKNLCGDNLISSTDIHLGKPYIVNQLVEVHEFAKGKGQYAVCVNVLLGLARIGKLIDNGTPGPRRMTQNNVTVGMSPADVQALLASSLGHLPASERRALIEANPELETIDVQAESESAERTTNEGLANSAE